MPWKKIVAEKTKTSKATIKVVKGNDYQLILRDRRKIDLLTLNVKLTLTSN